MFQFPGFASRTYVFSTRSPYRRGFPIRTSADQRSLASPRGFSQRATSFIASWCQGIHRTLFSHSTSPHTHPHAVPSAPTQQPLPDHQASASTTTDAYTAQQTFIMPTTLYLHTNPDSPVKTARPHPATPLKAQPNRQFVLRSHAPRKAPALNQVSADNNQKTPSQPHHGGDRIRTDDPLLAKQMLYQLSYAPSG